MENNYKITEEEVKEVFLNPTKVKGIVLREELCRAIKEKLGEEAIKIIEEESKNLGFPFKLEEVKNFEWYPAGIIIEILFILQEKFSFKEKDFAELGETAPKVSSIMRQLMRYFAIPEKIAKIAASRLWQRYFDRGRAEICEFRDSKEGGFLIIRVKNFKLHPLHFSYLGYFFLEIAKLTKKFKEIKVEETKSPFRGDEYQEYLIKWVH